MPDIPDIPDGSPWWLTVIQLLAWVAATYGVVWLTNRPVRRVLRQVADDAAATKEQAVNAHADAEYPNLREEVTAIRTEHAAGLAALRVDLAKGLTEVRDDLGGLHSETRDLRQDVAGIRTDARRDRRQLAAATARIDEHLAEVPELTQRAVTAHVHACPLRDEEP